MKITLGLVLDGLKPNISPSTIGIKKSRVMGLLAILETQCGIAPMVYSPTKGIIKHPLIAVLI